MGCKISVTFTVPKWAYKVLNDMATQNKQVFLEIDDELKQVSFSADMIDFGIISDDGGWNEINTFLEEVE